MAFVGMACPSATTKVRAALALKTPLSPTFDRLSRTRVGVIEWNREPLAPLVK